MNDRIKELMDKSDLEAPGSKWKEYFAELIIQECMSVATKQRKPANLNYDPSERLVEDLKRHFGIK